MSLRFSLVLLVACVPVYDPLVICHNANCAASGQHADDSLGGLAESLALAYDGKPIFDGVELDTFLYFDGTPTGRCLFAHDDQSPDTAADPLEAAALVAEHLQKDIAAWNEDRFYLKLELKPTVAGTDHFHTATQTIEHARCALAMATAAVAGSRHPVTVVFDTTSECLHNELDEVMTIRRDPNYSPLLDDPNIELQFSGPIGPERFCIPFTPDIRTFFVRDWRDQQIEAIRPVMVWLDRRSENTETLKIIRHLRPEFVATSAAPFVRGWIEGFQ